MKDAGERMQRFRRYRGTSLTRDSLPLEIYSSIFLGPYGGPSGGGRFLMSEVPLYFPASASAVWEELVSGVPRSSEDAHPPRIP
jgi:hypothetical protein